MSNNETMLSKEDYLALSTEYQNEKQIISKKYNLMMWLGFGFAFLCAIIIPIIFVPISFYNGNTYGDFVSLLIITFVLVIAGGVVGGIGASKKDKETKELGIRYYQKYVNEYNASRKV